MIYIIIPAYNSSRYLADCLNSVFAQTFKDFRVICVDDGSTDQTPLVLKDFATYHSNLYVIRTENHGPSHARNVALNSIRASAGDFVTFLDSDDLWASDYLEQMVKVQKRTEADIVCSSFMFYSNGRTSPFPLFTEQERNLNGFEATKELLADKSIQSHSHCKLYRFTLWERVRFPEQIVYMEDQATIFQTFCLAKTVAEIPSIDGYYYRQSEYSLCSSPMTNKRVLDSINGYLVPYSFDYSAFSNDEILELRHVAGQALAACFLMMYPRYNKKTATKQESTDWNLMVRLIMRERLVAKYRPNEKTERIKKICFLTARPLYRVMYNLFK